MFPHSIELSLAVVVLTILFSYVVPCEKLTGLLGINPTFSEMMCTSSTYWRTPNEEVTPQEETTALSP